MAARLVASLLLSICMAFPTISAAQNRVYRVGILDGGAAPRAPEKSPFVKRLAELGFVEGRNLVFERRNADYQFDRLPDLAAELVRSKVDVIVAMGPISIAAAAKATRTIPIVMVSSGDPVGLGLVASLSRPGGNLTGNAWEQDARQIEKTLQLITEVVSPVKRIAMIWHLDNPSHPLYEKRFEEAGAKSGVAIMSLGVRRGGDFPQTLRQVEEARVQAFIVIADYQTASLDRQIIEFARQRRLPVVVTARIPGWFDDAVMFYGPRISVFPIRSAEYVARILNGARPGDLPILLPEFELVINLPSANALGLTIPQSMLLRANEVIR